MERNCQKSCNFSIPLTYENIPPTRRGDTWNYSKVECLISCEGISEGVDQTITFIENPIVPGRGFYVEKTFSYGDALVVWFLTLFLIFTITGIIFNFIWGKR